jgi:choline dehydrogenase
MSKSHYDFIVIGAGSAGSVLANRLTADPGVRLLLLEAGPQDRSIFIHMPAAFSYPLANDKFNWYYHSEPEPYMDNRRLYCPRGRVVGGSSSINGMAYVRGHALDYDRWEAEGADGWSYAAVLPYFRRAEHRERGGDLYRGDSGPLRVSTGACQNVLFRTWVEAGMQAGYPYTEDMNGYQQEGMGAMDMTVHGGERWSASKGYLKPVLSRDNLDVETGALVHRILIESGRARGVEYSKGGSAKRVEAGRVIVCAGAINSPQLLMLSGIGPAPHLEAMGIPVAADVTPVGQNLQDHLEVYVQHACRRPVSIYPSTRPLTKLGIGLKWILSKKGWGATSHFESGGFIRSRAGIRHPNLQYHFLPIAMNYDGRSPAKDHGFQAHVGPMRPTSTGSVTLRSANPADPPRIQFNYMATENDRQEMREGVRLTREIFAQAAFDELRGDELSPGAAVETDAELDAFVREKGESAYHPSCTCRMGKAGEAVVDPTTEVYGVGNLNVVDASIMPSIVSGNLNAPTIMVAEKSADHILGNSMLAPEAVPVFEAEDWEARQR